LPPYEGNKVKYDLVTRFFFCCLFNDDARRSFYTASQNWIIANNQFELTEKEEGVECGRI